MSMLTFQSGNVVRKRQSYLSKGKELLRQGKKSDAHNCFQKCVNVSPEMALALIKVSPFTRGRRLKDMTLFLGVP